MADLPTDALPGEVHRGPDNCWYQLEWSGNWKLHPRPAHLDHDSELGPEEPEPEPARPLPRHVIAAGQRIARREQEEARAQAAERRRHFVREEEAEAARQRLGRARFEPSRDDGMVDLYDGDYDAVIAEVPEGQRRDGWTVERRLLFLDRLSQHGCIVSACAAAGCTRQSAYRLRPRAPAFAAAMDEAMRTSAAVLYDTLFERALHGHEVPMLHKGEVVATRTVHHDQLGIYLLKVRDPLNYAPVDELERWKKHRTIDLPSSSLSRDGDEAARAPTRIEGPTESTSTS
jgi:hypothetical protein